MILKINQNINCANYLNPNIAPQDPYDELYKIVVKIQAHDFKATKQQLEEGFEFVRMGLAHNPNHPGLYIGKGFLELVMKETDAAIRSFKQANQINDKFHDQYCQKGDAYFGLGAAYLMQGKRSKAKEKLTLAKEMGNLRAPVVLKKYFWFGKF